MRPLLLLPLLLLAALAGAQATNVVGGPSNPPTPAPSPDYTITYTGGWWETDGDAGYIGDDFDGPSVVVQTGGGLGPFLATEPLGGPDDGGWLLDPNPGDAACGGPIVAHFHWNGGTTYPAPAPGTVLVTVTASASWSVNVPEEAQRGGASTSAASGSGRCSNGHDSNYTPDASGHGGSSTATWGALKGGASFTVSGDPEAYVEADETVGTCAVGFTASYFVPKITLTGGIADGDSRKYLVGQRCVAELDFPMGGPFPWNQPLRPRVRRHGRLEVRSIRSRPSTSVPLPLNLMDIG